MNEESLQREYRLCAAWMVGWVFYMLLVAGELPAAGIGLVFALPFHGIVGLVFSLVLLGISRVCGYVLRFPSVSRWWYASALVPSLVIVTALIMVLLGRSWGWTIKLPTVDQVEATETMHPLVAYGAMFAAIFATLHFPTGSPARDRSGPVA